MTSSRKLSLVTGLLFLLTFIHVLILPLYDDILNDPEFILGEGSVSQVKLGALIDLIVALANAATGVLFFQVLRRQNVALSLGYAGIRIFEATIILVGTVCLLGIVTLREDFSAQVAANPDTYTAVANSLVAVRDWTFFFGPGVCAGLGSGLVLGFLVLRSGLMPRNLALFGVIGGPLSLIGLVFVLFGQWEQADPPQFLFTAGEIVWELGLSIYLIVKGFKSIPITSDASLSSD